MTSKYNRQACDSEVAEHCVCDWLQVQEEEEFYNICGTMLHL